MNIVSIPHKRLWGQRSRFDRDFETYGTINSAYGVNLGEKLNTLTYYVTAGTSIVANQLFNNEHKKVVAMYISGADTDPHYVSSVSAVSSYPLSSYNKSWGWGLGSNIDSSNMNDYFSFYEHISSFANNQLEGMIDWSNTQTTITEEVSSSGEWFDSDKIVENLIDYELRRGLGLFSSTISAANTGIL